jgi:FtsH-binding integral membrane protein
MKGAGVPARPAAVLHRRRIARWMSLQLAGNLGLCLGILLLPVAVAESAAARQFVHAVAHFIPAVSEIGEVAGAGATDRFFLACSWVVLPVLATAAFFMPLAPDAEGRLRRLPARLLVLGMVFFGTVLFFAASWPVDDGGSWRDRSFLSAAGKVLHALRLHGLLFLTFLGIRVLRLKIVVASGRPSA